jgi:hypothetical protein
MFPSGAVSVKKDWFEFILDLNLLDTHLKIENISPGTHIYFICLTPNLS